MYAWAFISFQVAQSIILFKTITKVGSIHKVHTIQPLCNGGLFTFTTEVVAEQRISLSNLTSRPGSAYAGGTEIAAVTS